MTQQQIQQIFQLRYNQSNWKQFLSQAFLNARLLSTPEILTGINVNVATQALRLGYIVLNENGIERNIAVYDVTLAAGIILERNRVGLRNLLRKYWKDIDAAFIVYHRPENPNWRFTYVSELTGYDSKGELIKVKTEPKRFTYILGEGESCRTAAERFAIITKKGSNTTLDDVKDAFSVEKLSKSFFDEYKKHYELFCDYMVAKPSIRQTIFNGDEKAIRDFNKKLLGRIVFLYFIQKKGWMGVPEKSNWGQGDHDFLWNLFSNCRNKGIFYSEYLSKLFFDTLNTKRTNDIIELIPGEKIRIPFLNGGLFEEDKKKYRNLVFPADLFENFFKFFNQYNFTIYEDDPNDHTVAVDPEMLGHIFENLLEDNKDKGAYYTPKEIVHYMCQESLIEYLCTCLKIEDEAKEKEAVTILLKTKEIDDILKPEIQNINDALDKVKICDPAIGSGAFPMGLLKEIFTAKQTLYTFEHGNTQGFDASRVKLNIIQNSIYGVDIEKGAVDIARLRFWLSLVVDEEAPKALPNLDYKIVVGNSLVSKLGNDVIDIDWSLNETSHGLFGSNIAARKTELLKKISKEQKKFFNPDSDKKKLATNIRNLKIDLLINQLELMTDKQNIQSKPKEIDYRNKPRAKYEEDFNRYMQALGWKQQIGTLKKIKTQVDTTLNFFDWKLDFPEVLNQEIAIRKGFDIVIANPPYLGEKGNKERFQEISSTTWGKTFYQRRMDIFYYFFHLGLDLFFSGGNINFITTNYYPTATYANKLRDDFKKRTTILKLIDFHEYKIFNSAKGQHNLITFLRANQDKKCEALVINSLRNEGLEKTVLESILNLTDTKMNYKYVPQSEMFFGKENYIKLKLESNNDNRFDLILDKLIKKRDFYYGDLVNLNQGIVSGTDKVSEKLIENYPNLGLIKGEGVFIINNKEKQNLLAKDENIKNFIKPIYKNSDLKKWALVKKSDLYVIYLKDEGKPINLPQGLAQHFSKFKSILEEKKKNCFKNAWLRKIVEPWLERGNYFVLFYPREKKYFEQPKIVNSRRAKSNIFAYEGNGYYEQSDIVLANLKKTSPVSLKYLLALLNSKLYYLWLFHKGKRKGDQLELFQKPLKEIPIKISLNVNVFENLVEEILLLKSKDKSTIKLEEKIDNLVYNLYELSYEEVKLIDPEFSLTEQEYEAIKV